VGPARARRALQLAGDGVEEHFLGRAMLVDGVASVGEAVERLNARAIACADGFCIVYSATKAAYFLLYQQGLQKAALRRLGIAEDLAAPASPDEGKASFEPPTPAPRKSSFEPPTPAPQMEMTLSEPLPKAATGGAAGVAASTLTWRFSCIHAEGLSAEQLAAMNQELRDFEVPDGTTLMGRHHQPLNFEAWLPDPILRFCISRTHMQIVTGDTGLAVTNMSSNLLCVDRQSMTKGESRTLAQGQVVSFARQEASTSSLVHFLVLQVRCCESLQDSGGAQLPAPAAPPRAPSPSRTFATGPQGPPPSRLPAPVASPAPARHTAAATTPVERTEETRERPTLGAAGTPGRKSLATSLALSSLPEEACGKGVAPDRAPPIVLELLGEAVLDLPASQRSIGPVLLGDRPLLVGRRHQPELHQHAIEAECLELLSRDDFCIAYEGGEFWLLALTSNRIWRARDNEKPTELARDDLVTLLPGDRVLLGYSEAHGGHRLCWAFKHADGVREASPVARTLWWIAGGERGLAPCEAGGA